MKNSKNNISDEKMLTIKDRAINSMMDALVIFDHKGKLTYTNPAFLKMLGYGSIGEIRGKQIESFWMPEDNAAAIGKLIDKNGCWSGEVIIRKKDSSGIHVQISANLITDETGRTIATAYLLKDITKWMLAEKSLKASEERYRLLADNVTDVIFIANMNFQYTYVSPSAYRLLGYTVDEAMTMKVADVVTPETFNLLMGIFIEEMEIEKRDDRDMARSRVVEYQHIRKDGSKIWVETTLTFLRDENNTAVGVLGIVRDISKRKLSEIALAESFERYRLLADNVTDVIFTMDMDFQYTYVSPSVHRLFGYTVDEAMTMEVADVATPETLNYLTGVLLEELEIEKLDDRDLTRSRVLEYQHIHKNGSKIWAETTLTFLRDENNTAVGVLGIVRDISKRKQLEMALADSVEKSLKASEERYRLLADNATDIIFTMDMNFNYTYVSPSAYRLLGYTVNELTKMKMADVVTPETFNLLMDVFVEEMEIEKRDDKDLTRSRVLEYQHRHKNGSKIWMETTLNFLRDQNNTVVGVLGIVRDISKRKLSEMALADSFEKLRKTLDGTVQAISLAVETRDPYTAGHQRRVAELAVAIADQMGVEDDIIQGIRIAGSIHDIGKVAIPAEFLTKPGGIMSDIEYTVIKAHSYIGYEILKSIDFPWPIAQIVYQHHERLDGSGYPRGLTGDKILFEAKILAVADVVESMASHRPYRVAKGINKALLEIKGKRGVLYDGDVVDACLVVLNEKGFEFVSKSLLSG